MILSPNYKKKIIVNLSRFPYPLEKGDKLRAYYQIIDLSKEFDVYLFCTTDKIISKDDYNQLAPFCKEIHIFKLKKYIQILSLFRALFTKTPFQVAFFTQKWIKNEIYSAVNRINPDFIYNQLIRSAEYVKNLHNYKKVIDLMDALSKGMERRVIGSKGIMKFVFKEESVRLLKYETRIIDYFDKVLIISQQDKQYIIHPKNSSIHVIANGVGDAFLNFSKTTLKKTDLLFTGNMGYAPNIKASSYLVKTILPELKKLYPSINLVLAGANPSKEVQKLAHQNIKVTGWVDDIKPYYAESKIFIAPMLSGSGQQNKILEAMAMGIPCITTSLANNAILAQHDEQIIIADSKEQMILAVQKLIEDEVFYSKISTNSKKFVLEKYNWFSVNRLLIDLIKSA